MSKEKLKIDGFGEMCCNCGCEFGGVTDETLIGKCEHCGEVQHVCSMCPCTCGYRHDMNKENCEGCIWEHICEKVGEKGCGVIGCPDEWNTIVKNGQAYFKES